MFFSIRRFAALVNLKGKLAEADILVKESVSANGSRIYTIELQEIKKPLERGTKSINVEAETDPQHTSNGRDKVALLAQKVNPSILLSYKNIPAEQRYSLDNNDIRFSYELKNPDGTVFGWYNSSKGEIWLNDDAIDFDTPIHEFTHAWSDIVEREDPRLANPRLFPAKKRALPNLDGNALFFDLKRDNYACASSSRSSM